MVRVAGSGIVGYWMMVPGMMVPESCTAEPTPRTEIAKAMTVKRAIVDFLIIVSFHCCVHSRATAVFRRFITGDIAVNSMIFTQDPCQLGELFNFKGLR